MPCLNADGSLSKIARDVLTAILNPGTIQQINQQGTVPLYRIRSSLRELTALGYAVEDGDIFRITETGVEALKRKPHAPLPYNSEEP